MSTRPHLQPSITWNQVAAFRLARHHLLKRAQRKNLLSVVSDMCGAQAQLLSAAQTSLWSRVRNLQIKHIEDAMDKRTLVKASCMRRTLFLVPSEELAVFVRGSARRAQKEINWALKKGVPERVIEKTIDKTLGVLDEPLTRSEIAERASRALGVQKKVVKGGGWGSQKEIPAVPVGQLTYPVVYLLHVVAARGIVCYGPYRGNEPTFVRADAWIPDWQDVYQEQAESLILRKYLQSYGPATPADFAMWCGISQTEARQTWAREQDNLATVDMEGWEATVLRDDLNALTKARFDHPSVCLLPYFDTFLIGHKDRDHLAAAQHRPKIYRPRGWISPVVLVDGRAVAVWKHTQEGNRLLVTVTKFESLSRQVKDGIREETQDLGRFLGVTNVDVKIV